MIPTDVENRIAKYFFHMYLPEEVMVEIEGRLLPSCTWKREEDLDHDELVHWAIKIIQEQLGNKKIR